MTIVRTPIRFIASPERVLTQYLFLPGPQRVQRIADRVAGLSDSDVAALLDEARSDFGNRHRYLDAAFQKNYALGVALLSLTTPLSPERQRLVGAFLTKEYSTQSAALFNPSIVPHPDQTGLPAGTLRFVMSLRATGEGHISSIEFRTGTLDPAGELTFDPPSQFATGVEEVERRYTTRFMRERLTHFPTSAPVLLDQFPDEFTEAEAIRILDTLAENGAPPHLVATSLAVQELLDTNYDAVADPATSLAERVLFPVAKGEKMGMEDARFVRFFDGNEVLYYASYTAYDGKTVKTQLIETEDFRQFRIRTLYGKAISDKGMALFPEKIGGRYAMIARQGGQNVTIMFSENLYCWNDYQVLLEPLYPWEFVQLGNCGSPLKTEHGWLLLTHGVGLVRRYVLSAVLLDLHDPTKVIGRLKEPLVWPLESEREGYVPNVVYTCGWLAHGDRLVIPYAMSDTACGVITASQAELVGKLLSSL